MFEPTEPDLFGRVPERDSAFLSQDDVERALEVAFEDELERRWANEAWAVLIGQGCARYSNELERCEAAINLIALVEFYKDWLAIAAGEERAFRYYELATALSLAPLRLGQLVGRLDVPDEPDFNACDELDDEELFQKAIFHFESEARPVVVSALKEHYGEISGLFVALWNSNREPRPDDYEENREEYENARNSLIGMNIWAPPYRETDEEILNDVDDDDKMELWTWLDQGAEVLDRS